MATSSTDSRRDPVCGMRGIIESQGYWFCSHQCVDEFRRRKACDTHSGAHARRSILLDPWFWVPLSAAALAALGEAFPRAAAISALYRSYIRHTGLPIVLGLLVGGLVDYFIPKEYIIKVLTGSKKRVILRSSFLGFVASTCSHGCLALSLELFKKGASIPAVVSFLLASPWASMPVTFMLFSFFGLKAALIIAGALLIAILTGLIFQRLDAAHWIESNPNTSVLPERFSIKEDLGIRWAARTWTVGQLITDARGIIQGMIPLGRMTLGWVQVGLIISAVSGALVPAEVFGRWLGPTTTGLLGTLFLATIIEVCSEGTAPVAFELYRQTGAFGNAFAFLMGGVVTDYTELGALWITIGRRTVFWFVVVTMPLVFMLGITLNQLFK